MADAGATRAFLVAEIEKLEPFGFVAVVPVGSPSHVVETTRSQGGELEVRIPGRPRVLPALPAEVQTKLAERGFTSKDPANTMQPWVLPLPDAEAAADLVQSLLVEVFGEKSDVSLDVGHGSHEAEHEAQQKLSVARTRIQEVLTHVLGQPAEQDADGDYVLPIQDVHVMVSPRAASAGHIVVRVFAITNVGVSVTPELGLFLARLNFGLTFGRFALDAEHESIWFDEVLLGEHFREEELRFAVDVVARTADEWDDRLKQMFGGSTYQEVLAGRTGETLPTTKPGSNVGGYL